MNTRLLCLALLAAAPAAQAQGILVVMQDNGPQVVRQIVSGNAMIEVNGKMIDSSGTRYALQKAAAYRKGFIKFSELALKETRFEDSTGGTLVTYGIDIDSFLLTDVPLKRCFIVLEITAEHDKGYSVTELPDLVPGEQRQIRVSTRLRDHLDEKNYVLHVFSDGLELLNSTMSEAYIAEQTRKTEEVLLKRLANRPVALSRGIAPVYPAELKSQNLVGSASVRCHINARGEVISADVVKTTHPLFGEAAAAAVRQWKFEPAIADHQFVEATVIVPFDFKPPSPGAAK